ncbi:MAG TPA: sigma 54-interacting transcriptional regulator [Vicinamibacterales bacterium]|nr:sigma 54-interacting transcriptional regulator [Vicinamibacterales bacterium]
MITPTLFADRFVERGGNRAIDLATGGEVMLHVADAGTRQEQAGWTESRARLLSVGRRRVLIDFGFVGRASRFEAYRAADRAPLACESSARLPKPAIAEVVEWLEAAASASRILRFVPDAACNRQWVEALAREVRLRGYIPLGASMFRLEQDVWNLLAGRSVVLFDTGATKNGGGGLCLSILQLFVAKASSVSAVVPMFSAAGRVAVQAAESRPTYGATRKLPVVPLIADVRAAKWLEEGRRWMERGRHAAAERSFRAAASGFERRGDAFHSADASMALGRLLLARGRAETAEQQFTLARDQFQSLAVARAAALACLFAGLAQTDGGKFGEAEATLRAAFTAASALGDEQAVCRAGVALARSLLWQERLREGLQILEAIEQRDCPRYWSLLARLQLAAGRLDDAGECARRARHLLATGSEPNLESIVRTAQAMVQARLGDLDALHFHVRTGVEAARVARLPLQALRLRLTLVEGLLEAGFQSRARVAARTVSAFSRASLPRVLRDRIDRLALRLADTSPGEKRGRESEKGVRHLFDETPKKVPYSFFGFSHETAAVFRADHTDRVAELLSVCQAVEDEQAALKSVAEIVRAQVGAVAVGIFSAGTTGPTRQAGVGALGPAMARRCMEVAQPMPPEPGGGGVEGAAPVLHLGRIIGVVTCRWTLEGPRGSDDVLRFVRIAAAACAPVLQILLERQSLPSQDASTGGAELTGTSAAIQEVRRSIARAANAPFTVLIEGESGAGKELVATAIHRAGCRRDKPLRALNCAALTEELVDSELFGHAKGAFTGAINERLGIFESADGGTVFLDEVGELSARAQAKLLRTLQEGEIRRIGENFTRPIDARLIAATNRSLTSEAKAGRFRQDLLYRLDVIRITVPPLRERVEDIPLLATRFWREAAERIGSKAVLGQAALAALARYDWPGNVRELQNVLAALAVAAPARGVVPASAMPAAVAHAGKTDARETLDTARRRFEERFVRAALARAAGHRGQTASALGVSRQGLAKLIQRLQLP